jgi:hypothetical protein
MNCRKVDVESRKGEKGAALVTSILISMLLLAVAGTVILTSGMSATTAIDATAEIQAFYGAESGLEAALNVIRGHSAASWGVNQSTQIGFRTAVDPDTSNRASDHSGQARLSAWLNYGGNDRVTPAGANYSFSIVVKDPDDPNGTQRALDGTYRPKRIQIQSTGYGPRGSVKRMEMIVQKKDFDFEPNAMLLMRGSEDGTAAQMNFDIGTSAAKFYSGHDNAASGTDLPTFGVTNATDLVVADDAITKGSTVEEVKTTLVAVEDLPSWLQTADAARAFLNDMQIVARSMGRLYTTFDGNAGSASEPKFTFVNGNCVLDGGGGLLIVTGNLVLDGAVTFDGVILVLGNGNVTRSGGGSAAIHGTIYVAKFPRSWPASENNLPHPFTAALFDVSGGGNSDFRYDSACVRQAKDALGDIVRDLREF